ncbi:MAG TPA: hypothetical protein VGC01_12710 [Mucilaginibacter sp.]
MNWKLIIQLSVFGLIMAIATISLIPQAFEPAFWLVIFLFCAYTIARVCAGKYFLHGFLVSLANCVWITASHIIFYTNYMGHHPAMVQMNATLPAPYLFHPRLMMLVTGAIGGIASGLILGLFAFVASKIVKKPVPIPQ